VLVLGVLGAGAVQTAFGGVLAALWVGAAALVGALTNSPGSTRRGPLRCSRVRLSRTGVSGYATMSAGMPGDTTRRAVTPWADRTTAAVW
jgi:hypothetical protein